MGQSERDRSFSPDPTYRLSPEDAKKLAVWVDRKAAENFLSGVPADEREEWLKVLATIPPGEHEQIIIQEIQPTGHAETDRAIWELYSRVREWGGGGDEFPFPKP